TGLPSTTSALPPKADDGGPSCHVGFGPEAVASFDHLVSAAEPMKVKTRLLGVNFGSDPTLTPPKFHLRSSLPRVMISVRRKSAFQHCPLSQEKLLEDSFAFSLE